MVSTQWDRGLGECPNEIDALIWVQTPDMQIFEQLTVNVSFSLVMVVSFRAVLWPLAFSFLGVASFMNVVSDMLSSRAYTRTSLLGSSSLDSHTGSTIEQRPGLCVVVSLLEVVDISWSSLVCTSGSSFEAEVAAGVRFMCGVFHRSYMFACFGIYRTCDLVSGMQSKAVAGSQMLAFHRLTYELASGNQQCCDYSCHRIGRDASLSTIALGCWVTDVWWCH